MSNSGEFAAPFERALSLATRLHRDQTRKGTNIPYLSHLLAVAGLVMEHGGNRDQAIAALLHDSIEDQAHSFPGGADALRGAIKEQFGANVLALVESCTNTAPEGVSWRERKQQYLDHLSDLTPEAHLIVCADKLHNARCILSDLKKHGCDVWGRFNASQEDVLWYYNMLSDTLSSAGNPFTKRTGNHASSDYQGAPLARELGETVRLIERESFDVSQNVVQGADSLSGHVDKDGNLVFAHYDSSEHAHRCYGNDVASYLIIKAKHKDWFKRRLKADCDLDADDVTDVHAISLALEKYPHFGQLEVWLRKNALPHEYDFNDWA